MEVYSQSMLAIIMRSRELPIILPEGLVIIALNSGSLFARNKVREGFGIAGDDLSIGVKSQDVMAEITKALNRLKS